MNSVRTLSSLCAVRSAVLAGAAGLAFSSAAPGAILTFTTSMNGQNEATPNNSPGTGTATITVDTTASTMRVQTSFTGLVAGTTAAHIHAPTPTPLTGLANPATQLPSFVNFPLGVTSGSYDMTFNMLDAASYNAAFVTANGGTPAGAFAALTAAFSQFRAYLNIHSSTFTGGEIRGFLVPSPGAVGLLGVAGVMAARRRR